MTLQGCGTITAGQGLTLVFGGFGGRTEEAQEQGQNSMGNDSSLARRGPGITGLPIKRSSLPPPSSPSSDRPRSQLAAEMAPAVRDMAQFVSLDTTSLLQPKVAGMPRAFDDAGCPCCIVPGDPAAAARGRPLHSAELYDPSVETWLPMQAMCVARHSFSHAVTKSKNVAIVALGGVSAGTALDTCEVLRVPADVGGDIALAKVLSCCEWESTDVTLPEPRSQSAAVVVSLALPPPISATPSTEHEVAVMEHDGEIWVEVE